MNLRELMRHLVKPDHVSHTEAINKEVVFDTVDRSGLLLLSVYYNEDDGKIHIDIGESDDDITLALLA